MQTPEEGASVNGNTEHHAGDNVISQNGEGDSKQEKQELHTPAKKSKMEQTVRPYDLFSEKQKNLHAISDNIVKKVNEVVEEENKRHPIPESTLLSYKCETITTCLQSSECLLTYRTQLPQDIQPDDSAVKDFVVSHFSQKLKSLLQGINQKAPVQEQKEIVIGKSYTWNEFMEQIPIVDEETYIKDVQAAMTETFCNSWISSFMKRADKILDEEAAKKRVARDSYTLKLAKEAVAMWSNGETIIKFIGTITKSQRPSLQQIGEFLHTYHMQRVLN